MGWTYKTCWASPGDWSEQDWEESGLVFPTEHAAFAAAVAEHITTDGERYLEALSEDDTNDDLLAEKERFLTALKCRDPVMLETLFDEDYVIEVYKIPAFKKRTAKQAKAALAKACKSVKP